MIFVSEREISLSVEIDYEIIRLEDISCLPFCVSKILVTVDLNTGDIGKRPFSKKDWEPLEIKVATENFNGKVNNSRLIFRRRKDAEDMIEWLRSVKIMNRLVS